MKSLAGALHRAASVLASFAMGVSGTGLFLMTLTICWQVFGRYVLNDSPAWSESLALITMLYFILFASAVGVYEGFHLGFGLLPHRLPRAGRHALALVNDGLIAVFGVVMARNGAILSEFTAAHGIPTLGISRAVAYWPFVGAGVLMTIFALDHAVRLQENEEG